MTTDGAGPRLVLWDIDHTLIDGGTVARRAYAAAFRRVSGRSPVHPWQFDGRTELAMASEVLRAHGLPPEGGMLDAFLDMIITELRDREAELAAEGRVLTGASEALGALGEIPGVCQSVLTGNPYALAVLKMQVFGLADHVDFRVGAYGDDAYERVDLPARAFARAEKHLGRRHIGADTVIVGDTPRDVAAARAVGAWSVAVATGTTSAAALAAAGADVVLADLADTDAVLGAVLGSA
ncbi:HAD family hydrolase [Embleya scabrispora]|uniref:HAD family hydrolase n=1 Tax=Embleya scabrispora TaxID=159449 RepID=UPI0005935AEA|nr:HAD family hydrolase [Embleya scabrispora]MYS87430.1 HAD hydrolase-like protein [Streptomyces sp. SID5474]